MKPIAPLAALLLATPAFAQSAPPVPPAPPMMKVYRHGPMFGSMTPEGRKILSEAMQAYNKADRQALRDARDAINAQVAAERLDVAALRRAMEAERRLVDAQHAKRQAALLAALQKVSVEDRRAFAQDATRGRAEVEARTAEWRKRAEDIRIRHQERPASPTPPAPPGTE